MIIAFDPGKTGAVAWGETSLIGTEKMPESSEIGNLIRRVKPTLAIVEKQQLQQRDLVNKSAYRIVDGLIKNYHEILYALREANIPTETVTAQEWQKGYTIPAKITYQQRKKYLAHRAKYLHPGIKIINQTADAVLILKYKQKDIEYEQIRSRRFHHLSED